MQKNNKKDQPVAIQGTQVKGATNQVPAQPPAHKAPEKHPAPAQKPAAAKPQQQQQQHPKPVEQHSKPVEQHSKPVAQHKPAPQQQQKQQQNAQPQKQQPQQLQQEQKQPQPPAPAKLEPKRKTSLKNMLQVIDQDKGENKISFIVDKTGNAYTFFKYKGTIIDISELLIFEHTKGQKREDSVEKSRKAIVYSLNMGDNLVFATDLAQTNLNQFFQSDWYKPECIFNYNEIMDPKYFRAHLLKPEEDKDGFGNKGNFYPKKEMNIVLLYTLKEGELNYQEHLKNLGLEHLKDRFVVTLIEE